MNWGQIQIESLKKMFLNNEELVVDQLEKYRVDKKTKINIIFHNKFLTLKDYIK